MKYIVYATINTQSKQDGKYRLYVGVHKTENPEVFDGYLGCGCYVSKPSTYENPKTPFQYAVKKYGPSAFKRKVLYVFDNAEEAYKMEYKIVSYEFIKKAYTYNVALGGIGGSLYKQLPEWHTKPLYQFDKEGNLIKSWSSTLEASTYYSEPYTRLDQAITDHYLFLGYFWSRESSIDIKKYVDLHQEFTYVYTKEGKLLTMFPSRTSCAKALKCEPQSISKAIRTKSLIKGYYVSNEIVDLFKPEKREAIKDSVIYVYDINNNFIGKGVGKEIMDIIKLPSYKTIWSAIYSNCGWYKNYYLSFTPVSQVPEKLNNRHRYVDIFTLDGEYIETLSSLKEVKEKYNLTSPELNRFLKGVKQHNKYIFKYKSK